MAMSIIRQGKVKTRKEHRCHGCARKFEKGTEGRSAVYHTTYWCKPVVVLVKTHGNDDEVIPDQTRRPEQ
jgi:hypothetical protein